jgi:hypothetical protein
MYHLFWLHTECNGDKETCHVVKADLAQLLYLTQVELGKESEDKQTSSSQTAVVAEEDAKRGVKSYTSVVNFVDRKFW